tara:strand:+ start:86 stop:742 length:657 start_codon:yes stop_codon:yes gene_type:complete
MNWKDIKKLIREELQINETDVKAGNTKFNLRMGVNRNKTKLGIKIQFETLGDPLSPDIKDKLEVVLQEKLNDSLGKYKMQVSKDTDVPSRTREDGSTIRPIAFFIPMAQIKALVVEGLGQGDAETPDAPLAPEPTEDGSSEDGFESPEEDELNELIKKEMISEMRIRDLNEASRIVNKDDFYGFINAGNNIIRDMEDAGKSKAEAKKYLAYLTKHNIM